MRVVVLKVGGRVVGAAAAEARALRAAGSGVVVVHGAGPQISGELERRGIPVLFVAGRRVTSAEALEVVRAALAAVNAEVCGLIGDAAVGLAGDEIGLRAEPVTELGHVGEPIACAPPAILDALRRNRIAVVSPLAAGPLNVNADEAAAALAVGLRAERILFLTDVPGVLLDGGVVEELPADAADRLLGAGTFEGGIVPKLVAAVRAAREGVRAEIGATAVSA